MNISWDLIRTFLSVSQTGSLSGAARALQLTQPTVGRHIDLLEDALNLTLFVRSREGMTLTSEGVGLVEKAHDMQTAGKGFERLAAGLDEDVSGVVRLSANEVFGVLILPRILPGFMRANPDIEIELIVTNAAANLLQRDADIAIRMFRPMQNDLVARKITELPLGIYAHQNYLSEHGSPGCFDDLRTHRFIGMDRDTSLIDAADMLGNSFQTSDFAFRCDNILTHIEAIKSGLGIGVTHQGIATKWDDVDQLLTDIPLPNLELWIACHSEVKHNKRIRLVMDFLSDALKQPYRCLTSGDVFLTPDQLS